MVSAAKTAGYEYIGITDHSVGLGVARGLDAERLKQQIADIKELNCKVKGIRVFSSMEVDIRADGSLDLPDELLAGLDIVVAAVHSALNQNEHQMTRRVLKVMENPNVDILAHPTSRLLPDRDAVALDMEAVFQKARQTGTILEINAMPSRLDLKDIHAYRARELGVTLAINTDAHHPEHLGFMRFGVGVARRAWCQSNDILNTQPLEGVMAYLESRAKGK